MFRQGIYPVWFASIFRCGSPQVRTPEVDSSQMRSGKVQTLEQIDEDVAALLSKGIRIPSQPKVIQDVLSMLKSNRLDIRDMAEAISLDAGLTALLYRLTRSAAFARRRAPESVEQILVLVGTRQTAMLVQSYGLTQAFDLNNRVLEQFWTRSTEIAQLASVIAYERISVCNIFPEQAFMVGIFHDCGVPVLMQRFPDYCKAIGLGSAKRKWPDVREEDAIFAVDHCSIGYLLARHWRLPDFVADAVLQHHELDRMTPNTSRSMVSVLQLAIHLYSLDQGLLSSDWERIEPVVREELGLHPDELPHFCDEIMELYQTLQ